MGRQRPNVRPAPRSSRRFGLDCPGRRAFFGSYAGPPCCRFACRRHLHAIVDAQALGWVDEEHEQSYVGSVTARAVRHPSESPRWHPERAFDPAPGLGLERTFPTSESIVGACRCGAVPRPRTALRPRSPETRSGSGVERIRRSHPLTRPSPHGPQSRGRCRRHAASALLDNGASTATSTRLSAPPNPLDLT